MKIALSVTELQCSDPPSHLYIIMGSVSFRVKRTSLDRPLHSYSHPIVIELQYSIDHIFSGLTPHHTWSLSVSTTVRYSWFVLQLKLMLWKNWLHR